MIDPDVDVTCKVAQLEFKYGSVERGKTLFEEIVTNLPRRTDVWSIYIDATIKMDDIAHARFAMLFFSPASKASHSALLFLVLSVCRENILKNENSSLNIWLDELRNVFI